MRFLKTVFVTLIVALAVLFGINNWTRVTINIWGGLQVDTWLPLVMLAAFLLGALPLFALHRATRWRLRRKLDSSRRALAETQRLLNPPPPASDTADDYLAKDAPLPPAAMPMAVPPGVL